MFLKAHVGVCDCFNPRARGGRDAQWREGVEYAKKVSIHAPAGGATRYLSLEFVLFEFQSTRPRGARLCENDEFEYDMGVSIHAPAGGATTLLMVEIGH